MGVNFTFKLEIHLLDTLSNKFFHFNEEGEFLVCKITIELRVFRHTKPLHISRGFKLYFNELCFLDKANRVQVNEDHRIHTFN